MGKIYASQWSDYELIDAGGGLKLERWGKIITIRPDVNAYFKSGDPHSKWRQIAHAEFIESSHTKGEWKFLKDTKKEWTIEYNTLVFNLRFTPFKHVGLFPEQEFNWKWIHENITEKSRVLNLFAYTGAASIAARKEVAEVYHVDSIKTVNNWAKVNMESSGLVDVRWVTEDALKFASREQKRGNSYDCILMDPPAFGLGPNKKRWKIENHYKALIDAALNILNPGGKIILNTYSPKLNEQKIKEFVLSKNGIKNFTTDTLCIKSKSGKRLEYGIRTFLEK